MPGEASRTVRPKTWTEQEDEQLLDLHAEGLTQARVSELMGKSHGAVQRRSKALGLKWSINSQLMEAMKVNQEKAQVRQAETEALLAVSAKRVAVYLSRLVAELEAEDGFFYVRGKAGEMVKKKRGPDDPLPMEHVESVVKMLNDTATTVARVKSMQKADGAAAERIDSLLSSIATASQAFAVSAEVLEGNKEVAQSE